MKFSVLIAKRSAILAVSNIAGQAILFLSPVILVRLLDVTEFGKYREFILYATVAVTMLAFGVNRSLPYFLPRYPDMARVYTTQSVLFVLGASVAGVVVIEAAADLLLGLVNFDFIRPLQLYVLFTINFDFLEMYWLARKQAERILLYSTGRLIARLTVMISAAAVTGDAVSVIWALIAVEGIRFLGVAAYSAKAGMLGSGITRTTLKLQTTYFMPLGAGALILILNENIGQFLVSAKGGVEALAFYVVGAFGMPIVHIVRNSIGDAIFPDMVERTHSDPSNALRLWTGATTAYTGLLFPVAVVFVVLADEIITILFTAAYLSSVPVFVAFSALMALYCFDFSLPLRVLNRNRYFFLATLLSLAVNVAIIVPAYRLFGIVGPALAFLLGQLVGTVFLGETMRRCYGLRLGQLVPWRQIGRIALAASLSGLTALAVKGQISGLWAVVLACGLAYAVCYLAITYLLGVWSASDIRSFMAARRRKRLAA